MATDGWRSDHSVSRNLREGYSRFDWYQLVRLLLAERAGTDAAAELDRHVRFRGDLSFAFPANEVTNVVESAQPEPVTVTTTNYSVAGYLGPLPEGFTEWLSERRARGDHALADFLDLFNNRLSSTRYRSKSRVRPALEQRLPQDTVLARRLAAMVGLGERQLAEQLPVAQTALLGVAGLLANRRRNPDTLERVLARYLGAPVVVTPLRGIWQAIPGAEQTRLGRSNSTLGVNAVLGQRIWDQAGAIEVRVGPVARGPWLDLLPNGSRHEAFAVMLRYLTDRQVDCHVVLVGRAAELPASGLSYSAVGHGHLGYTTWMGHAAQSLRETAFIISAYPKEPQHVG